MEICQKVKNELIHLYLFSLENKQFYNVSFNEILESPVNVHLKCLQGKMNVMTFFNIGENLCLNNNQNDCKNEVNISIPLLNNNLYQKLTKISTECNLLNVFSIFFSHECQTKKECSTQLQKKDLSQNCQNFLKTNQNIYLSVGLECHCNRFFL